MLSRIRIAVVAATAAGLAAAVSTATNGASHQPPPPQAQVPRAEGHAARSPQPATTSAAGSVAGPDAGRPVEHAEHDTNHVTSTVTDPTLAAAATARIIAELEGPAGCCTAVTVTALVEVPAAAATATVLVAWTGTRHDTTTMSEVTTTRWRSTPAGWQPVTPTPEPRHTTVIRPVGPVRHGRRRPCLSCRRPARRLVRARWGCCGRPGAAGALHRKPTTHTRAPKAPRTCHERP